jgi:hypothetical protein
MRSLKRSSPGLASNRANRHVARANRTQGSVEIAPARLDGCNGLSVRSFQRCSPSARLQPCNRDTLEPAAAPASGANRVIPGAGYACSAHAGTSSSVSGLGGCHVKQSGVCNLMGEALSGIHQEPELGRRRTSGSVAVTAKLRFARRALPGSSLSVQINSPESASFESRKIACGPVTDVPRVVALPHPSASRQLPTAETAGRRKNLAAIG